MSKRKSSGHGADVWFGRRCTFRLLLVLLVGSAGFGSAVWLFEQQRSDVEGGQLGCLDALFEDEQPLVAGDGLDGAAERGSRGLVVALLGQPAGQAQLERGVEHSRKGGSALPRRSCQPRASAKEAISSVGQDTSPVQISWVANPAALGWSRSPPKRARKASGFGR